MSYRVTRTEIFDGELVTLYLTEWAEWGVRSEAVEFDGYRTAKEMHDWYKYNSPLNRDYEFIYDIESD